MRRVIERLAFWVFVPLLMGASGPIEITTPTAGTTMTWMPVSISVNFDENANDATLLVTLNGNDITSHFTLDSPSGGRVNASAVAVWEGFVNQGGNQIDASIELSGSPENASRSFTTTGDPFADAVVSYNQGTNGGFNAGSLPGVVLGPPNGSGMFQGGLDVVSLGKSGSIVLRFDDNVIVDGTGVDFTVFENAFLNYVSLITVPPPFAEPARVSVSQNGVDWEPFSCTLITEAGPYWPGCAGIYPVISGSTPETRHASIPTSVPIQDLMGMSILSFLLPAGSGGDSYDLADVGLSWVRYVKIEAADFDVNVVGPGNSAFDLDAVAAVHSSPSVPAVPTLSGSMLAMMVIILTGTAMAHLPRRKNR